MITVSRDGAEIGEWTQDEVIAFYREGRLIDTDFYWQDGMTEWVPLSSLIRPPPTAPMSSTSGHLSQSALGAGEILDDSKNRVSPSAELKGIGRLCFLGLFLAIIFGSALIKASVHAPSLETSVTWIAALLLVLPLRSRLLSMGYSGWFSLLFLLPVVDLVLVCCCLLLPAEYKKTKKVDAGTRIGFFIIIGIFLLVVVGSFLLLLFLGPSSAPPM